MIKMRMMDRITSIQYIYYFDDIERACQFLVDSKTKFINIQVWFDGENVDEKFSHLERRVWSDDRN